MVESALPYAFFVALFGLVVLRVWRNRHFFGAERGRKALRNAALVPIADAIDGRRVAVVGRVQEGAASVEAPLSGRRCLAYRIEVERYVTTTESSSRGYWRSWIVEQGGVDLELAGETGRAVVPAADAELLLEQDAYSTSGSFELESANPNQEAFLRRHRRRSRSLLGQNFKLRYKEGIIERGEIVAAVGVARWKDEAIRLEPRGYRSPPGERVDRRLVLASSWFRPVVLSDRPEQVGALKQSSAD